MSKKSNWGGVRKGAGRKREKEELAKDRTKVIRVSESEYVRIRNGIYEDLITGRKINYATGKIDEVERMLFGKLNTN